MTQRVASVCAPQSTALPSKRAEPAPVRTPAGTPGARPPARRGHLGHHGLGDDRAVLGHQDVGAAAAELDVLAVRRPGRLAAADEGVVALVAAQPVVAAAAEQVVVTDAADQHVVVRAAEQHVRAGVAEHQVVAVASVREVRAVAATEVVRARTSGQTVVSLTTEDAVPGAVGRRGAPHGGQCHRAGVRVGHGAVPVEVDPTVDDHGRAADQAGERRGRAEGADHAADDHQAGQVAVVRGGPGRARGSGQQVAVQVDVPVHHPGDRRAVDQAVGQRRRGSAGGDGPGTLARGDVVARRRRSRGRSRHRR